MEVYKVLLVNPHLPHLIPNMEYTGKKKKDIKCLKVYDATSDLPRKKICRGVHARRRGTPQRWFKNYILNKYKVIS